MALLDSALFSLLPKEIPQGDPDILREAQRFSQDELESKLRDILGQIQQTIVPPTEPYTMEDLGLDYGPKTKVGKDILSTLRKIPPVDLLAGPLKYITHTLLWNPKLEAAKVNTERDLARQTTMQRHASDILDYLKEANAVKGMLAQKAMLGDQGGSSSDKDAQIAHLKRMYELQGMLHRIAKAAELEKTGMQLAGTLGLNWNDMAPPARRALIELLSKVFPDFDKLFTEEDIAPPGALGKLGALLGNAAEAVKEGVGSAKGKLEEKHREALERYIERDDLDKIFGNPFPKKQK